MQQPSAAVQREQGQKRSGSGHIQHPRPLARGGAEETPLLQATYGVFATRRAWQGGAVHNPRGKRTGRDALRCCGVLMASAVDPDEQRYFEYLESLLKVMAEGWDGTQ